MKASLKSADFFGLANHPRVKQFVKFCLVGGSGVLVDMALLHFLARQCNWDVSLAKLGAAEAAMLNNFFWNKAWTFRREAAGSSASVFGRLLRFHLICGIGIGLAVLLLHLFYTRLGLSLLVANGIAIVLVTTWNFWMNALFNWRRGNAAHP